MANFHPDLCLGRFIESVLMLKEQFLGQFLEQFLGQFLGQF